MRHHRSARGGGLRAHLGALASLPALILSLLASTIGCASRSQINADLASAVRPVPSGVRLTTAVAEYPVSGASIADIRREMAREGTRASDGRRWPAVTRWRIRWTFEYERQAAACAFRTVRVMVDATVDFSRWDGSAATDTSLVRWWDQFRDRLLDHEAGHVRIAAEGGREVYDALRSLQAGTCEQLATRANFVGREILFRVRDRQATYDLDTRHGARPGTPTR
ncbi:MAG TPA: DUF922 domain-containing protein [Gemmatimonadaceae bacterium]|nr:DUF922 domain-containing protein [Gemmatimonadaceae bacterium]